MDGSGFKGGGVVCGVALGDFGAHKVLEPQVGRLVVLRLLLTLPVNEYIFGEERSHSMCRFGGRVVGCMGLWLEYLLVLEKHESCA